MVQRSVCRFCTDRPLFHTFPTHLTCGSKPDSLQGMASGAAVAPFRPLEVRTATQSLTLLLQLILLYWLQVYQKCAEILPLIKETSYFPPH